MSDANNNFNDDNDEEEVVKIAVGIRVEEYCGASKGTITELETDGTAWCKVDWDDGKYPNEWWLWEQDFRILEDQSQ